jgi:hypothetical protein
MNNPSVTNVATWASYAKTLAFLLPALFAWWFSAMFLFPKLQQIWADTRFSEPAFLNALRCANFLLAHTGWILATVVAVLALLELHDGVWSHYRRMFLAIVAWVLNAAVLLLLTAMLLSVLMAAPGLVGRH